MRNGPLVGVNIQQEVLLRSASFADNTDRPVILALAISPNCNLEVCYLRNSMQSAQR